MREISVLHIVISTVTGGMENVIYNLASSHVDSRLRLSVGCLVEKGFLSEKLAALGVESHVVPKMMSGISLIYPRQLIKFIKNSDCDIVHTHSGCWNFVAAACAFLPNKRLVYTEHGRLFPDKWHRILFDRMAIHFTDKVVAVGDSLREYLVEKVGLPANKVLTINNGIDTKRFRASEENRVTARSEFGYADENVVIGIVARLSPIKNHRFLIDAFEILNRDNPQTRLLIIGDGPLRGELEEIVESRHLNNVITFTGDRSDVSVLLSGLDILTLCSLSEGTSLTILEAMSTGLPAVVTDVGGNRTIIEDGKCGFLVESGNAGEFIEKLARLVGSSKLREKIGNKAREHIVLNWSLAGMAESYEQLYMSLMRDN